MTVGIECHTAASTSPVSTAAGAKTNGHCTYSGVAVAELGLAQPLVVVRVAVDAHPQGSARLAVGVLHHDERAAGE